MVFRVITGRISNISEILSKFSHVPLRIRAFHLSRPVQYPKSFISESTQSAISINGYRVSRVERSDAQAALFDYLHYTRGFQCTDAEYISQNSPHFVQNLLSKVENDEDVSGALSKFFLYHPINEFEPFLESLGLTPSELNTLLPRNLMFLSDDRALLDNFHVLCNYGIPRSKIGKIYKEANEIFRFDSGMLQRSLMAYEEAGLSKSNVIKMVTCCPPLLVGGVNKECIAVLEKLKALGFGNDWLGWYLSDNNTCWNKILKTMNFLCEVGYSDAEMRILFKANPALLFKGSRKSISYLVSRFLKLGIERKMVYSLFVEYPEILSPKGSKNLWKAVDFLLEIGMETEDIANIVSNSAHLRLLCSQSLVLLRGDTVTLCQTIKEDPLKMFNFDPNPNNSRVDLIRSKKPGRLLEKTKFLLKLGYVENSEEMAKALKKFEGRGDLLQERFDFLVQAGLDINVVSNMIKQAPQLLTLSKDTIEKKIDCLRNYMDYPLETILEFPAYLNFNLKRIQLRYSMYVWLRNRGAAKPKLPLCSVIAISDVQFVKYFVDKHPEGPAVWDLAKKHGPAMWEDLKKSVPSS